MSTHVNNQKRERMAYLCARCFEQGWTRATLAAVFGVSTSATSSWARGDSMGTNDQRDALLALKSPKDEAPRLRKLALNLRALAATCEESAAAWAALPDNGDGTRGPARETGWNAGHQRKLAVDIYKRVHVLESIRG